MTSTTTPTYEPVDVTGLYYDAISGEYLPKHPDVEPGPDYPLTALVDMAESAVVTLRTIEDQLREHGRSVVPSADTGAFDTLIKGAYLKAEDDVTSALSLVQHAAQLVKGLAR